MLSSVRAFVRLSRLKFLVGGFLGGAFGTAMAAGVTGHVDAIAYACAQGTITAFHLMTHYANDYFDRTFDARSIRTPYSGGSGALVDGSLAPRVGLAAALVAAGLGAAGIAALIGVAHTPPAAGIAAAIGFGAWSYSAPPLRLLGRGLGEIDTAIVVALLVPLCAYAAQGADIGAPSVASTLPGAAAMFAMMLAVEYPDLAADAAGGKRNLVVRYGTASAGRLGLAAAVAVYAGSVLAVAAGAPRAFALFELLTLPVAIGYARALPAWGRANRGSDEALAARGVAFFFVVALCGLLAYAAPLRPT
ncbi:MAG: prenyltransferase [Vulcanimicrobiaceae bacterium]